MGVFELQIVYCFSFIDAELVETSGLVVKDLVLEFQAEKLHVLLEEDTELSFHLGVELLTVLLITLAYCPEQEFLLHKLLDAEHVLDVEGSSKLL